MEAKLSKRQSRSAARAGQLQLPKLPAVSFPGRIPEAVFISILEHLPLRDRLARCALVCQSWAAAAALTTMDLAADVTGSDGCRHMQIWLEQFAGQVASMSLDHLTSSDDSSDSPAEWCINNRLLLPCSKLTRLETLHLEEFPVVFHTQEGGISTRSRRTASTAGTLSASSCSSMSAAASGSFLPVLRELALENCFMQMDSFMQLSQLSRLASLRLYEPTVCTAAWKEITGRTRVVTALTAVLQQLQQLQQLRLEPSGRGFVLDDKALAPLSTMQHLQRVSFNTDSFKCGGALAHLPTNLTNLQLYRGGEGTRFCVSAAGLPQLPVLREVHLANVKLDVPLLGQWTGLHTLDLHRVGLCTDDDHYDAGAFNPSNRVYYAPTRDMLRALGKLTELQHLHLYDMQLSGIPESQLQLLSALTASTQLESIILEESGDPRARPGWPTLYKPVPMGALQHMFPAGHQWPRLHTLKLVVHKVPTHGNIACVAASGFSRLANALPALETLHLVDVLWDTPGSKAVAALARHMTGVRYLYVTGHRCDDRAAARLAQMTQLVGLWWGRTDMTLVGLQKLTALTQLEDLAIATVSDQMDRHVLQSYHEPGRLGWDGVRLRSSPEAVAAGAPDVWQQLQRLCDDQANAD